MKKMTRFLALVTVLVLMLSMSVTAFAASVHSTAPGTCIDVSFTGHGCFECYHSNGHYYPLQKDDVIKAGAHFSAPTLPYKIVLDGEQVNTGVSYPYHDVRITNITNDTLYGGGIWEVNPQPQPKTGVMDTLPLWFGVMAVSACAYILTSKKKVF